MISLLGIVIGLALFILLAYMGYNTIIVAIASAMVVAVFGGMNPFVALTEAFMPKTVGFMQGYFLIFLFSAFLPVAIGLYLPLELSATIMIGGVIRWIVDKKSADKNGEASGGVLFCSGLIAGEGLVGILLAILAVVGVSSKFDLSSSVNTGRIGGIVLLAIMIACVFIFAMPKKKVEK